VKRIIKYLIVLLAIGSAYLAIGQLTYPEKFNTSRVDSLTTELGSTHSKSQKIKILTDLATLYLAQAPKQSIEYANEALEYSSDLEFEDRIALLKLLATAYDRLGNPAKSISIMEQTIEFATKGNDSTAMAEAYNFRGYLYLRSGDLFTCISNYETALQLATAIGRKDIMADAYYGLYRVNAALEEWEQQVHNLERFLTVTNHQKDARRVYIAYLMLGDNSRTQKQFSEAFDFYHKAYKAAEIIDDSIYMALTVNHIAWAYYEKGELKTSLEYYQKNLDLSIRGERQQTVTNVYGNIGNIYRDWQDYELALEYYNKSIELSRQINDYFNLSWLYMDISRMYADMENFEKAYETHKLHTQYNDSITNQQYENRLLEARARYEAEKSEQALEVLSLRLRQNRVFIYGLAGGLLAILIIGALIFQRIRMRSKQRMTEMNHTISELNQQNLRQQMNPHFVFNTLNSIQYYVFRNDKIASNNYMSKFAALMRKTLENSRHTAIPIKDELDALELYLELESLRFKEKFEWNISVDEEIDTLLYKIPTMLIQPYVENSLSHGLMNKNGKGYVYIDLKEDSDSIKCIIEDNGIGRKRAMEIRKSNNRKHNSLGTTITESRLKLVNEIYGKNMKIRYTDLNDENNEPSGTRVEISIPIIT